MEAAGAAKREGSGTSCDNHVYIQLYQSSSDSLFQCLLQGTGRGLLLYTDAAHGAGENRHGLAEAGGRSALCAMSV